MKRLSTKESLNTLMVEMEANHILEKKSSRILEDLTRAEKSARCQKISLLEHEKSILLEQNHNLNIQLSSANDAHKQDQSNIKHLQEERNNLSSKFEQSCAKTALKTKEKIIKSNDFNLKAMVDKIPSLENKIAADKEAIMRLTEIYDLNCRKDAGISEVSQLRLQLQGLEETKKNIIETSRKISEDKRDVEERLSSAQETIRSNECELKVVLEKISTYERSLAEKEAELNTKQELINTMRQDETRYTEEKKKLNNALENAQNRCKQLELTEGLLSNERHQSTWCDEQYAFIVSSERNTGLEWKSTI
ncbi:hypothetical protein DPMN_000316 [Dreissena polymorpha]|uniref:Uncharacterized protein n=1 Tax=Dreissena polymorpha TaxID=45954 RepID=A0A9D4MF54_DREPO|nr:hypothetical protein DPMN_000316 [Dreissena polymorpha]